MDWISRNWNFFLDNHPFSLYLSMLVVYYLVLFTIFVLRKPRALANFLHLFHEEPDREAIIREINRERSELDSYERLRLRKWQKARGI